MLIGARRAHPNNARLPVRVLFDANHLGPRGQRVPSVHRMQKPAFGISKVGNRIQGNIRHGFSEYGVERYQVIDRRRGQATVPRELRRTVQRMTRRIKRMIKRHLSA